MRRHANELPEGRAAEKTLAEAQLAELLHHVGTHTQAIARMSGHIVNDVLLTELIVFPPEGFLTREFGTSVGCVAVANHSTANPVIVAAGGAVGDVSPASGVGRARINASCAMTVALSGPVITFWGTAGQAATVQVFTRAWPPAFGPA